MVTKRCANPNCGKDLPLTDFNKNRSTCKYCDRKRAKEHREKRLKVRRQLITRHLGKVCVICGEKRRRLMRSHEKYGKPHPNLLDTPLDEIKKNCKSGRFVRVCAKCHGKAQDLLDKGIGWDFARFYIKEFMESKPPIETDAHLRAWHKWMRDNIRDRQLRLPIEVETVKSKLELEKERLLAEERLHHREIPRYEGSLLDGTWHQIEDEEEEDNWEDGEDWEDVFELQRVG